MSTAPIARDPIVGLLLDDGYVLAYRNCHLIVRQIPYRTASGEIAYGMLAYPVTFAGDTVVDDTKDHTIWFIGETPHETDGSPIAGASAQTRNIAPGLDASFLISQKPKSGSYANQYDKVSSYARILSHPAQALDPRVTPTPGATWEADEDDLPFVYPDTATTRAGLGELSRTFQGHTIAIVGLGGTGGYILDQVSKTPVKRIILIDGDLFENHNAYRAPGAADLEELRDWPNKVDYFKNVYSKMHTGIETHAEYLHVGNLHLLSDATFVFLAAADAAGLTSVVSWLEQRGTPFIDVGMGIAEKLGKLTGTLRVTNHFDGPKTSPSTPDQAISAHEDVYDRNIQVADLNALNALLAVAEWKRHLGYYATCEPAGEVLYGLYMNDIRTVVNT